MKSSAVHPALLSESRREPNNNNNGSNIVDEFGFLVQNDGDTDHTIGDVDTPARPKTLWSEEALCKEESWWASDFLLYLTWRAASCQHSKLNEAGEQARVTERSSAEKTPEKSSRCDVASSSSPVDAVKGVTSASPTTSASLSLPPPPMQSDPTDVALLERWFRGRWEARLRQYGGCPHMALRRLLWGFFSGAWQQRAAVQAAGAQQYADSSAEPAAVMEAGASAAHADYVAALEAIDRDIGRTFPHHILFHGALADSTGQRQLRRLLRAYAACDAEVGYCQGMAFVAAVVLMVAPEAQAYQIFCALMRDGEGDDAALGVGRHGMRQLYRSGFPLLQTLLAELESQIRSLLPALAAHLQANDVHVGMFASRWFLTLFVHQLPPPLLLRVWDFFMVRGWAVMVQVAVALLHQEQGALLKLDLEGILLLLKVVRSQRQSEGELLRRVCNVPLL